jgi:hypothetical protein
VNILLGKTRTVLTARSASFLLLQANISRAAQAERQARELAELRTRQVWLERMIALDAVLGNPAELNDFVKQAMALVDRVLANAACPDVSDVLAVERITEAR